MNSNYLISFIVRIAIGVFIAMGFTVTYAQLEQFLDPNDPYNLTKVCNNYVNSPLGSRAPDAQIIVMCSDYLNQTMLDRFGIVK
jgi:uncharacterized protein YneF (UPF0154 family)